MCLLVRGSFQACSEQCTRPWDMGLFINLFLIVVDLPYKTLPNIYA